MRIIQSEVLSGVYVHVAKHDAVRAGMHLRIIRSTYSEVKNANKSGFGRQGLV